MAIQGRLNLFDAACACSDNNYEPIATKVFSIFQSLL